MATEQQKEEQKPTEKKKLRDVVRRASISSSRYLGSYDESAVPPPMPSQVSDRHFRHAKTHRSRKASVDHGLPPQRENLWKLMASYQSIRPEDISQYIVDHIEYTLARSRFNFDDFAAYQACAFSVRDRLIEFWNDTLLYIIENKMKKVYYLSIEYLMGRSLQNNIVNMGLFDNYHQALLRLGYELEDLYDEEQDAALGNGGLGRLAACFLDSLATLNYPSWGYGLRYQYGMFKQGIHDGYQTEMPDFWLRYGNPWEISRHDTVYNVKFYGDVTTSKDYDGNVRYHWENYDLVAAKPYDTPIPGYGTKHVSNLRLWRSFPSEDDEYSPIYRGDYYSALQKKQLAENVTGILYPNDTTRIGYELRLKQEYFFVSSSIQDIIKRFKLVYDNNLSIFHEKTAIQLNDTHPALAPVELLRILIDEEGLSWDKAWNICYKTFSFTNHTVLPEAQELWELPFFESLLPRHMLIIYEINQRFLDFVSTKFPENHDLKRRVSIIEESSPKMIRMTNISIICSHVVNGVAEIHTDILCHSLFKDFYHIWPEKFINISNGVTPRRWIDQANPDLCELITKYLNHDNWLVHLDDMKGIRSFINDSTFRSRFYSVKIHNKLKLAKFIHDQYNVHVNHLALFDVQVKRIHEYKRQLLNILGVIWRYLHIKDMDPNLRKEITPRVFIFSGKAAPGYTRAKTIIKLINEVCKFVNKDEETSPYLKSLYIENYNVSLAELIIPASDISQHISTAGTEASGTSNMKFCMNGGLILGTHDGTNIEIMKEVGKDNIFLFGTKYEDVESERNSQPIQIDYRLERVVQCIKKGYFGNYEIYRSLIDEVERGSDYYLVSTDFESYVETQNYIDECWKDKEDWLTKCIWTTSSMGKFSADRAIKEYAEKIWKLEKCQMD